VKPFPEKKGRGRPPKFSAELMRRASADGLRSRHGQHDRIYAQLAIAVIKERYPEPDEHLRWLFDEEKMMVKWSLLAELGRVCAQHGERAFWQVTEQVLEQRPKVKDAIRTIRRVRTGRLPREDGPGQT
jgi:hypothetical protein